jgi:uncharacterized protein YbbC (DUF1343 family)
LNAANLPGLKIAAAEFRPDASKYKGERCRGVRFQVTDRAKVESVRTGITLATAIQQLYAAEFKLDPMQKLLLHSPVLESIRRVRPVSETMALFATDAAAFQTRRGTVLLYQ